MATVYLAKDVKHAREVAIKVLHPELAASIGGERFEREIRLAANLQHPHILGLYDSGNADGLLYYVMPFVDGESLRARLDREGQLPVDEALRITLEVANALGHAHQRGIVHRDIKPENILLTQDHSLVADFGIARAVSEVGTQKLTQTGMALGTPLYMAPEQAAGEQVGPSADLYSLGCVLYEMLAGEPPFTGKNSMAIMARHAMEQVPSIRIVRSAVPESVEEAIFAVLGKVPADRPQTAAAFADLMDMPLGSTATMRIRNLTAARRTPPVGSRGFLDEEVAAPWWKGKLAIAAMALVLIGGAGSAWSIYSKKNNVTALSPDARRIAVMYFTDQSKDKSLQAVSDGLTEGLIRSLGSAPSLTVLSRTGVEPFRDSKLPIDSIARALRVGYIVRGEVEPDGNDVRVSVSLDDATGFNIKRSSFVRPATNLLALRDTLTIVASDMIKQTLHGDLELKEQRGSTSTAAWILLQRGEQARKKGESLAAAGDAAGMNASFAAADSLYALAEKADSRWSDPVVARAQLAYRHSRLVGRDIPEIRKWVTVGMGHANRALALDPQQADALEVRGNLQYWSWLVNLEADPTRAKALLYAAKADLEKATQINGRQAGAFASLSHLYYQTSTNTDINIAAQRALEADEFLSNADVILGRLFLSSYDLAQFDKAEQWCGEVRRRFPASTMAVQCQLYLLTGRGKNPDVAQAWKLADSIVALAPTPAKVQQRFATNLLVAAVLGRASKQQPALADSAKRLVHRSEGDATFDATRDLSYTAAFVYNLLGDKKEALRSLKDYLAANPQKAEGLRDDAGWWFKDLEQDATFRQLVGRAN
jgi:serine/threonine-protein kinase